MKRSGLRGGLRPNLHVFLPQHLGSLGQVAGISCICQITGLLDKEMCVGWVGRSRTQASRAKTTTAVCGSCCYSCHSPCEATSATLSPQCHVGTSHTLNP